MATCNKQAGVSVETFLTAFDSEQACLDYVFYHARSWARICPKCRQETQWRHQGRRYVRCLKCHALQSALAGTVFNRQKLPIRTIFYASLLLNDIPGSLTNTFLARQLGISDAGAQHLGRQIRMHMAALEKPRLVGGPGKKVMTDETIVTLTDGEQAIVVGMYDLKNLYLTRVSDRKTSTLHNAIMRNVRAGSILVTDGWSAYRGIEQYGFKHIVICHGAGSLSDEYGNSTAPIELVWKSMKRAIRDKRGKVSSDNLWLYVKEFLFKFHTRNSRADAFWRLISTYPPQERYDAVALASEVGL